MIKIRGLGKLRTLNHTLSLEINPRATIKEVLLDLKKKMPQLNEILTGDAKPVVGVLILLNEIDCRLIYNEELKNIAKDDTLTITIIPVSHGG